MDNRAGNPESIEDILAGIYQAAPPAAMQHAPVPHNSDSEYDPEKTLTYTNLKAPGKPNTASPSMAGPATCKPEPSMAEVASRIVTWSAAVRHINKLSQNQNVATSITALISAHDTLVADWSSQMYKAVERDREFKAGQKKIDAVLHAAGIAPESDDPNREDEMTRCAKTVYSEQSQTFDRMSRKLAEVGVPFFGTKKELIVAAKADGKVTEQELKDLRKRMIEHLEALFREEN